VGVFVRVSTKLGVTRHRLSSTYFSILHPCPGDSSATRTPAPLISSPSVAIGVNHYLTKHGAAQMFEQALEEARTKYGFFVFGYVVMPEHVHILVSEPERV
jgi:hypothetical protein